MKNIIKLLGLSLALIGSEKAFAQPNVDLVLTGSPTLAVYPGYPMPATYTVTLTNASGISVQAGHFQVVLTIPTGFTFDTSYPGLPAGWSYTVQPDGLSISLVPTAPVSGFPPAGLITFNVPMHTNAAVNSQPYAGQIQILFPSFQDPNTSNNNPQGTVTVLNAQALPVDFSAFNVRAEGCKANVNWATATEVGSKYYAIERSTDGIRFEAVGSVDAKGTNGSGSEYNYTDASPANGKNFYRIKQYGVDGKSNVSQTQTVSFNCGAARIELFPNPTSEVVNVKGLTGKNTIKILTVAGHEIMKAETELATHGMRVDGLASGTYQVQVIRNNEIVFNGKFVKAD